MIRKIVRIDEEKCNGCGLCINGCHEGALALIDGKAKLISDSYCDGLGACLPNCPVDAIKIEEREADEFDEELVKENMEKAAKQHQSAPHFGGCPSSRAMTMEKKSPRVQESSPEKAQSELRQWPVQIKLVPANAPYFNNANLLVAADCTAFAYADFHKDFMRNKITIIGCPKLDDIDYANKLTQILANNNIKSITILRMEVPCCGGIVSAVKTAILNSGKLLPWQVVTISTDGEIIEE